MIGFGRYVSVKKISYSSVASNRRTKNELASSCKEGLTMFSIFVEKELNTIFKDSENTRTVLECCVSRLKLALLDNIGLLFSATVV